MSNAELAKRLREHANQFEGDNITSPLARDLREAAAALSRSGPSEEAIAAAEIGQHYLYEFGVVSRELLRMAGKP